MGFVEEEQGTERKAIVSVYEVPDDILDREYPVLRFMGATKNGWSLLSTTAEEEKTVTMT